jgi:hypothetical protein
MYKQFEQEWSEHLFSFVQNVDETYFWWWISRNPNITWKTICDNPDKRWNWNSFSYNPNITWEIISASPDKHLGLVGN